MGDIKALAQSIEEQGLLRAIGITDKNVLVFGHRRLLAVQSLGWDTVEAKVVNVTSLLAGEYAENEIRKDFTIPEKVAIGQALEAEIGNRQGQRTDKELPQNFVEVTRGKETLEIAAELAGFGNKETYRQAKSVVEHGTPELIAALGSGNVSISAAAEIAKLWVGLHI
ncbi:ParB-like nuclease domain protein [Candidatus Magnetobacterium bavaricum]|uniref:ParB-like nuclease domain protein n=1 Tax=Candidatus Magnetobacterium bavaricum TaxID=29290 RepID=A0A0F3GT87_9BACT|nr:ParB-like nuclease domain protein [Candidatus Magnetobacterium bavaricum]